MCLGRYRALPSTLYSAAWPGVHGGTWAPPCRCGRSSRRDGTTETSLCPGASPYGVLSCCASPLFQTGNTFPLHVERLAIQYELAVLNKQKVLSDVYLREILESIREPIAPALEPCLNPQSPHGIAARSFLPVPPLVRLTYIRSITQSNGTSRTTVWNNFLVIPASIVVRLKRAFALPRPAQLKVSLPFFAPPYQV